MASTDAASLGENVEGNAGQLPWELVMCLKVGPNTAEPGACETKENC